MVSRKTMFGIGLPKDPTDPQSTVDPADQSQPTVVDDEKVAEGLKQLRSWYQETSPEEDTRRVVAPPGQGAPASVQVAPAPAAPQARPTAVGHATNDTPPQTQRPIAPDPMRATMFGHDVHRFDLEAYMAANATPPLGNPTAQAGTIPPLGDPSWRPEPARQPYETRAPHEARHHVDGVPRPVGAGAQSGQSGPSQLADFLRRQAERPNPAALRMSSLDDTDSYAAPRVPMSARIVLVTGLAALTVAVVFWIRSRSSADLTVMPPGPAPAIGAERLPARAIDPGRVPDTARRAVEPAAPSTVPAPPRPPSEAARPAIPPLPAALVKEVNAGRRSSSAEIAPAKAVRRARVAPTSRPSTDPPTEALMQIQGTAADEKPAGTTADAASAPPAQIEAPIAPAPVEKVRERRSTERERVKRAAEKDNDATLPPSAE